MFLFYKYLTFSRDAIVLPELTQLIYQTKYLLPLANGDVTISGAQLVYDGVAKVSISTLSYVLLKSLTLNTAYRPMSSTFL